MDRSFLIKPLLDASYPIIDYGKGCYLYDTDGKRYLDGCSGAVTANIGHGVDDIIQAMNEQAEKVSFVYRSQFTSEAAEKLAKEIAEVMPGDLNWSFFVNSGSEATETALKIAIQHWQERGRKSKVKVLSRWISYHGITLGALSMSGHPLRRARFIPLLEEFPVVSPPYCYRCPYQKEPSSCDFLCANELELAIHRIGAEQIAAFIFEPIIGAAGGAITPPDGYLQRIRDICDRHDILLISDEVMTGFGRTGKMLACEHWGVQPDIVALGKGMGAGYTSIAATLVSDVVMEPILSGSKLIMSGHTLSANPQSCATALAVMNYIKRNKLIEDIESKSTYLKNQLERLEYRHSFIGEIRGMGLMVGLEFVSNKDDKTHFPKSMNFTSKVIETAQRNGLLVYPASAGMDGISGSAIIIAPPLTITKREIDELVNLLKITFNEIENWLQQNETE